MSRIHTANNFQLRGHLPDGSSVQRHSAGGLYPFVLYAQQVDGVLWHGYMAPGRVGILVSHSYDEAAAAAVKAKTESERLERQQRQLTHYQTSKNQITRSIT